MLFTHSFYHFLKMSIFLIPFLMVYAYGHQNTDFNNLVNPEAHPHVHSPGSTGSQPQGTKKLWEQYGNINFIHEIDHLKEEANNLIYMQKSKQITDDETAFLFTKLHDFNSDGKLDGLELLLAVHHSLTHHNSTYETVALEDLSEYVDSELNQMDLNNDGFVDYGEIHTFMQNNKKENQQNQPNNDNNNQ